MNRRACRRNCQRIVGMSQGREREVEEGNTSAITTTTTPIKIKIDLEPEITTFSKGFNSSYNKAGSKIPGNHVISKN